MSAALPCPPVHARAAILLLCRANVGGGRLSGPAVALAAVHIPACPSPRLPTWATHAVRRYTSKYVVVAMPPHLTGQIIYTPDLPRARNQLTDRTPMGTTVKVGPAPRSKGEAGEGS